MPIPEVELQSRMSTLRRGQGSGNRRRQRRASLQPGVDDLGNGSDPRQCRRVIGVVEPDQSGVPPFDQLAELMDFWEELAPTAVAPVSLDIVDMEAELDAQLVHLAEVPPPPTVDQQTEAVGTGNIAVRSFIPVAAVNIPCRGRNMGINTDDENARGYLPDGCSLSTMVNTALTMPSFGSGQIAAHLMLTYGPSTRGHRRQLGDILHAVIAGQRAIARCLVRILNDRGDGTRMATVDSIEHALRELEEQAGRFVDDYAD